MQSFENQRAASSVEATLIPQGPSIPAIAIVNDAVCFKMQWNASEEQSKAELDIFAGPPHFFIETAYLIPHRASHADVAGAGKRKRAGVRADSIQRKNATGRDQPGRVELPDFERTGDNVVFLECGSHRRDPRRSNNVVGVAACDRFGTGFGNPKISRVTRPLAIECGDDSNLWSVCRLAVHRSDRRGVIRRVVVDDDDFPGERYRLGDQRIELASNRFARVVHGYDHRQRTGIHVAPKQKIVPSGERSRGSISGDPKPESCVRVYCCGFTGGSMTYSSAPPKPSLRNLRFGRVV